MAAVLKAVLFREYQQHPLQPFVAELDYPAAPLADEVLMVALGDGGLIALEPLAEFMRANQAAFHQEVQGPVNGGHSYLLAVALQLAANALDGEVIVGKKDDLSDEIPLAGKRLMMFPEIAVEALEKSRSLSLIQSCH
jgi:hypothetical protein